MERILSNQPVPMLETAESISQKSIYWFIYACESAFCEQVFHTSISCAVNSEYSKATRKSHHLLDVILIALVAASSLWVYLDATKHNIGVVKEVTDERKVVSHYSAGQWAISTLLLWIVVFPLYLIMRNKKIEIAKEFPVVVKYKNVKAIILGAIGVVLTGLAFVGVAQASLPSCDSADTRSIIQEIVEDPEYGLQFVDMRNASESGFDNKREVRICNATLVTTSGSVKFDYKINWDEENADFFWVELMD